MCSRERNCICDSGVVGNARPCQGRDRGFEPRLSLYSKRDIQMDVSFLNEPHPGLEVRASPLRSGPRKTEVHRTSCAVYRSNNEKDIRKDILFRCRSAKRSHSPALRLLVSASRLHFVSVVSKPTSTGCRETVGAEQTSTGRLAPVYRFFRPIRGSKFERLHFASTLRFGRFKADIHWMS